MKPAFFGSSACQLFGIHEPPRAAATRSRSVLLCYPGVQEYNMAHWAFRRLSSMLAREGIHVLRFDWSGTGDSWGQPADVNVDQWIDDVGAAARELRDASGADSVSIVGLRLGATIATLACAKEPLADELVLWEPVIEGSRYVAGLEELDDRENRRFLHPGESRRNELVGFPFRQQVRSSVDRIDLYGSPPRGVKRVLIVTESDTPKIRQLERAFADASIETAYRCVPEDAGVTNAGQADSALLASRSLVAIADHLLGRAAS
jgi:pimeloyl-ACP methyl ester carboxylesterase